MTLTKRSAQARLAMKRLVGDLILRLLKTTLTTKQLPVTPITKTIVYATQKNRVTGKEYLNS
jgi:hypothetical protein